MLLRAGEIVDGLDAARERRHDPPRDRDLARGPARLASCLGLGAAQNGADLCAADSPVRLVSMPRAGAVARSSPARGSASRSRSSGPWRFWLDGDPTVSHLQSGSAQIGWPDRAD